MLNPVLSRLNSLQLTALLAAGISGSLLYGLDPNVQPVGDNDFGLNTLALPDPPTEPDYSTSLEKLALAGFPRRDDDNGPLGVGDGETGFEKDAQATPTIRAVMISGGSESVLVEWDGQRQTVQEGEQVGDWIIASIDASGVRISGKGDDIEIELFAMATPPDLRK
jgi:hypothetical protein